MSLPVHLVGSIGLDTVDDVFAACGELLGPYLKRVPDGEPGGRRLWISWQFPLLRASPFLKADVSTHRAGGVGFHPLMVAEGVNPEDVRFGELGYAREARASYLDFVAARDNGVLPSNVRFQVCLPTPFAVVAPFVAETRAMRSCGRMRRRCCARSPPCVPASRTTTWRCNGMSVSRWLCGTAEGAAGRRSLAWRRSSPIPSRGLLRRCPAMSNSAFISATAISTHATSSSRST